MVPYTQYLVQRLHPFTHSSVKLISFGGLMIILASSGLNAPAYVSEHINWQHMHSVHFSGFTAMLSFFIHTFEKLILALS